MHRHTLHLNIWPTIWPPYPEQSSPVLTPPWAWACTICRSPLAFFSSWLDRMMQANVVLQRHQVPPGTSDHTVLTSLQGALMQLLVERLSEGGDTSRIEGQLGTAIHNRVFVEEVANHFDFQRVGGVMSHVRCVCARVSRGVWSL